MALLLLTACASNKVAPQAASIKVVTLTPPAYLYGECGHLSLRELAAGDTVADLVILSVERKTELDKCIEAVKALKEWSDLQK